ncbi:MAG: phosphoribosylamine--glycine ligase, partial [Arenicellales bacterium]|nr:phosphoribosylamine--glycine ligase [Arenicellales bacterium]
MKVLVVGAGGREHALAWKLAQSSRVSQVFVAPGNGGTALEAGVQNIPVSVDDTRALIHFAREEGIALTVIGPEGPLVEGVVDHFREAGLRCFGPGREAAQLEGSKSFAKSFLFRHNIPTAGSRTFSNPHKAKEWIREQGAPVVIKADGLAAGKGVTVAMSVDEALQAVDEILVENRFGEAGALAVVEEWLEGEEASFICMVNGQQVLPLATSQDHKA